MTRAIVVALAPLLLLLSPAVLAAPASEAHPDCEAGQPWIGYRSTERARTAYGDAGAPGGLALCEGEQWDGQDPLESSNAGCAGAFALEPAAAHVGFCQPADPNAAGGNPLVEPAGARASAEGSGRVYVAANVAFVARGAVYADEDTAALYARDNTPGNMIAMFLYAWYVTQPIPSEVDCDQATYQQGHADGARECWRDNTAFTFEHGAAGLLP